MNREIKFRAWTQWKTMVDVPTINFATSEAVMPDGEWCKVKLMQYTGLKDKSGKEIYEGDIVEHRNYIKELLGTYEVRFEQARFVFHDPTRPEVSGHYITPAELEVIGNIYENKELVS